VAVDPLIPSHLPVHAVLLAIEEALLSFGDVAAVDSRIALFLASNSDIFVAELASLAASQVVMASSRIHASQAPVIASQHLGPARVLLRPGRGLGSTGQATDHQNSRK